MNEDQIANIAYLGLLGAAVGGSYIMSHKNNLGKVAQQAVIWGLIFVGVIAAIGLWGDVSRDVTGRYEVVGEAAIEVPRSSDGHYYLTLDINGVPVDFFVDTGATDVVLTQEDARRVGIDIDKLSFLGTAYTANGPVATASVWLNEMRLGPLVDYEVRASVNGGEMRSSLLGMAYLGRFTRIAIEDNRLVLTR